MQIGNSAPPLKKSGQMRMNFGDLVIERFKFKYYEYEIHFEALRICSTLKFVWTAVLLKGWYNLIL
jgi:hypothetical protein